MPRRTKKSSQTPLLIASGFGLLIIIGSAAFFMRGGKDSNQGVKDLDVQQYIASSSSMRGSRYRLVGRVDDRLDPDWTGSEGRVFSVSVAEGRDRELLPIFIPSELNNITIDRTAEYVFIIKIGDDGVISAESVSPT